MPARDDQTDGREARFRRVRLIGQGEPVRVEMAFQVIDADQRQRARAREALGDVHADEKRPCKPRPHRDRECVQIVEGAARRIERGAHDRHDLGHMAARGEFGHHTAVVGV